VIVDHRTYTFRPGTLGKWVKKFETEGLAIQKRHLGHYIGLFVTDIGNLHQTILMWGYDSIGDRETRRAAMNADPAWQKYMDEVITMDALVAQEIKIIKPTASTPKWT
jgi:hypothetical protein